MIAFSEAQMGRATGEVEFVRIFEHPGVSVCGADHDRDHFTGRDCHPFDLDITDPGSRNRNWKGDCSRIDSSIAEGIREGSGLDQRQLIRLSSSWTTVLPITFVVVSLPAARVEPRMNKTSSVALIRSAPSA